MKRLLKLLCLPLAALSLLLMGCGVPIAPEAITATAVAEQEAASRSMSTFGGSTSGEVAQELRAGSAGIEGQPLPTIEPLIALPSPTPTATPEAEASEDGDEDTEDETATPEGDEADGTPTVTPTPEPTATPAPVVADVNTDFATEFLALLNAQRTGRGLGPLTLNVILTNGSTQFAGYMGTANFFGHNGPDGSTPASRAAASGYSGHWNGEALSAGQATPQAALNALLASPPHAAILLDAKSGEVGVGYAFVEGSRYRHYWVIMTGIP